MRCLLADESEENAMASSNHNEVRDTIVDDVLESVADGMYLYDAVSEAIEAHTIYDDDKMAVIEHFGTLDLDSSFSAAYDDFEQDILEQVDMYDLDEDDEDEEDEE